MQKTNAIRILESRKILHKIVEYEVNEDEIDAVSVAQKINKPPEEVFKTLVARANDNEILVFLIPGNFELDLKKSALASGKKKIELIHVKEIEPLTGYIRGGCSPIGMKKQYKTYIDDTAQLYDEISISAGKRGIQILINPFDLSNLIDAKFCDIT
ncbi:MAG: Cys-tRNA(Pro) deacylase [Ignavibacteria bacterium]|nr:Cys-tRNA(Pro) deacylase [Ignavibacteria bacterium]